MLNRTEQARLPKDKNRATIQLTPDVIPLDTRILQAISSSTDAGLLTNTGIVRVYAETDNVYLRWRAGAVSATNGGFDELVLGGSVMDFIVPHDAEQLAVISTNGTATIIQK